MDTTVWTIIGCVIGAAGGLGGGALGLWATYRVRGRTPEQRAFLRRFYAVLVPSSLVFAMIAGLYSFHYVSWRTYAAALLVFMAASIGLSLWMNKRLAELGPLGPEFFGGAVRASSQAITPELRIYWWRWTGCLVLTLVLFLAAVMAAAFRVWPIWTVALIVPLYIAAIFGLVLHAMQKFGALKQIHYAWRRMTRPVRE